MSVLDIWTPRHAETGAAASTPPSRRFSTFEKAVLANSAIIVLDTAAGWWLTQHNPETFHYVIDTSFIVLGVLLSLLINFALLRAAFAPLRSVMNTIGAVEEGDLDARVDEHSRDSDAVALARTFNAMLDELARARDDVADRVLRGQEAERRRIALELHDQTGQSLTALALHANAIAQRLDPCASPESVALARSQAERLAHYAEQTLVEVQALARQLRPPLLDDLGIAAALRWLASSSAQSASVSVRVRGLDDADTSEQSRDGAERLPPDMETALFRISQECLANALRHGAATRVRIALAAYETHVVLSVADDGRGFVPGSTPSMRLAPSPTREGGLGLAGMRERARILGGTCLVRSSPGHGCVVRVVVPRRGADVRVSGMR